MRSNNAIAMIENQIEREIDKLNSILTEEADKPAIIQRIADLKAMLDHPTQTRTESTQPTARELISELIAAFRRR